MNTSQMEEERWRHAEECRLRRRNFGGQVDTGIVTRKFVNWWWVNLGWELKTPLNCYSNMLLKQPPRPEVEEEFGLDIKREPACDGRVLGAGIREISSIPMSLKALGRKDTCRPCQ